MTMTLIRFPSSFQITTATVSEEIRKILGKFSEVLPVMMIVDGPHVGAVLLNYHEASEELVSKLNAIDAYRTANAIRVEAVVMPRATEKDDDEIIDDMAYLDFLNTYSP